MGFGQSEIGQFVERSESFHDRSNEDCSPFFPKSLRNTVSQYVVHEGAFSSSTDADHNG